MNCSIVIRAYNEARHLPWLLEGIGQQTVKEVVAILVDSGSTDDTVSIAEFFGRGGKDRGRRIHLWQVAQPGNTGGEA